MARIASTLGRHPRVDLAVEALTNIGIFGGLGFGAVLFVLWIESQRPGKEALRPVVFRAILAMIIAAGLSVLAGRVVNWVPPIHHPMLRNFYPAYFQTNLNPSSFPSQSTAVCAAIAASLYAVSSVLGTLLWVGVVVLVAAPRVFMGGHYPTDIVAGVACALAGFVLAAAAGKVIGPYERFEKRRLTRWIVAFVCFAAIVELAVDFRDVLAVWKAFSMTVSQHSLRIGGDSFFGQHFIGKIDEIRIYDRALSPAEVMDDMTTPLRSAVPGHVDNINVARGPVAAFDCDQGTGNQLLDVSGHGHPGVLEGVSWSTNGRYGKALLFDGQSSVKIADSPELRLKGEFTLEAWVYPTTRLAGWSDIIYKEIGAYYLSASSDLNTPAGGGELAGVAQNTYSLDPLPQNTWTHLAAIYDGRILRLLINGKDQGTR